MPHEGRTTGDTPAVTAIRVGYARVSTDGQDLTAQRQALAALGVPPDRIYVDHGITGTHRQRPGLREALAACRPGDTLVVTKLDRLARSVPDARDIVDELTATTNGSRWPPPSRPPKPKRRHTEVLAAFADLVGPAEAARRLALTPTAVRTAQRTAARHRPPGTAEDLVDRAGRPPSRPPADPTVRGGRGVRARAGAAGRGSGALHREDLGAVHRQDRADPGLPLLGRRPRRRRLGFGTV